MSHQHCRQLSPSEALRACSRGWGAEYRLGKWLVVGKPGVGSVLGCEPEGIEAFPEDSRQLEVEMEGHRLQSVYRVERE